MLPNEIKGISLKNIKQVSNPGVDMKDIAALGANTIRLPVYPGELDLDLLELFILLAKDNNLIPIIDNHEIADLNGGTLNAAKKFWDLVIDRYGNTEVIFELFNEPINTRTDGFDIKSAICWDSYFKPMNELANYVRRKCSNHLLIGTPALCGVLSPSVVRPIDVDNMAYTAHIYPPEIDKRMMDIPRLKQLYDFRMSIFDHIYKCASQHEVVITEFGWGENPEPEFMKKLHEKLSSHGWVAWVYDDKWRPPMLTEDCDFTTFGQSVKELLQ